MAYNDVITRADSGTADLPEAIASELVTGITRESVVLGLGRRVPTTTKDSRIPVLETTPDAYWVDGDSGLKGVSKASWAGKPLVAEELAVVVPIPDAVVNDSEFNLWEAVRPLLVRAFARKLDAAVLFGIDAPASWGTSVVADAVTAGSTIQAEADSDLVADVLHAAAHVGADGYIPKVAAVRPAWQYDAAAQRTHDLIANPIGESAPFQLSVAGLGIRTDPPRWVNDDAEAIVADWSNVLVGIRQDFTVKMFDAGVLQDETGAIVRNLIQQDTTAMRAVMRVGYLLAKPVTDVEQAEADRSPAAVVLPEASS